MKKLIATTIASSLLGLAVYAQGTVNLANFVTGSINAPIFQSDGTTKLIGPTYSAGLMAGATSTSLSFVGSPVVFLTGGGAGFIPATAETLTGIAPGATAFVQMVAWNSSLYPTFAAAEASGAVNVWGASQILQVTTGGSGSPPSVPAPMTGLTSFSLTVPEPSTFALAGLGAAALMIFRRRK